MSPTPSTAATDRAPASPALVIPLYNHGSTLGAVVRGLLAHDLPILIVDDGSEAETAAEADRLASAHPEVSVLRRAHNGGRGAALSDGYRALHSRGFTHAIQLDADGQHRTDDVPAFLRAIEAEPEAIVLGDPQFDASAPKARLYGRMISIVWVWIETLALHIRDPLCGFRAFPLRETVALLDERALGLHMEFDVEVLVRLHWRGVPVRSVPTAVHYPQGGLSNFDVLWDNIRISWTHTKLVFGMVARAPRLLWQRAMAPARRRPRTKARTKARTRGHGSPLRSASREASSSAWHGVAERGSVLGLRISALCYRVFGRTLTLLAIGVPVTIYFWATGSTARRASRDYLDRLYRAPGGPEALGGPPTWRSTLRHMFAFATTILDRFCFFTGSLRGFQVEFVDREPIKRHLDRGQGVLLVGSHVGSFDVMRVLAAERKVPVNVVMYTRHAERINGILRRLNPEIELRAIQLEPGRIEPVFEVRDRIAAGELVAVLADRVAPHDRARTTRARFLGAEADFPQGAWLLAHLLGCPVVLLHGLRTGPRRYQITAEAFADRVELPRKERAEALAALVARYAERLEQQCLRAPYQWFNFFSFWDAAPLRSSKALQSELPSATPDPARPQVD